MKFNEDAIAELAKSPAVLRLTEEAAGRVLGFARSGAPVDQGDYEDGLDMELRTTRFRVVWVVIGRDWKTMLVEAMTGNLQKALRRAERG
jgi:hypothetical protein